MVWPFSKNQDEQSSNNDQGQNQYETKSFYKSYSKSKSCKNDPQDNQYMICKQTINDGNKVTQIQQRYRINRQNPRNHNQSQQFAINANFKHPFFRQQEFQKQFQNMGKAIHQTFQSPIFALFGSDLLGRTFESFDQQFNNMNNKNRKSYSSPKSNRQQSQYRQSSNHFFSHNKDKDYDVKDL